MPGSIRSLVPRTAFAGVAVLALLGGATVTAAWRAPEVVLKAVQRPAEATAARPADRDLLPHASRRRPIASPPPSPLPPAASGPVPQAALAPPTSNGIPAVVTAAYIAAAGRADRLRPACQLSWPLLAGVGFIESGHARGFGSELAGWNGTATPPILGPLLDGTVYSAVADTDGGRLDGNTRFDRAVGPMQFIPSTWARWGVDASGDRVADPQNIRDAAAAAGDYLCASGASLRTPSGLVRALYSYNRSYDYVRAVLRTATFYGGDPGGEMRAAVASLPPPAAASPSASPSPSGSPSPSPSASTSTSTSPAASAAPSRRPSPATAPSRRPSPSPSPSSEPDGTPLLPQPSASPSPAADASRQTG